MTEFHEFPESDLVDRCLAVAAVPFYVILIVAAALVLLVGCAPTALGLPAGQPPAGCLPEGFPPQSTWQAVSINPTAVATDYDGAAVVTEGRYDFDGHMAVIVLTPFGVASIDPSPEDPRVPVWINLALMTSAGRLRAVPEGPCVWQRLREETRT